VSAATVIKTALAARTLADAEHLDRMIAAEIGSEHYRPIGDKVNNFGLMTTSGSYDYKLIENVTNMQDALLERAAMERFDDLSLVPYTTPHQAASALFAGRGEAELARCASVEFFEGDVPAKKSRRITPVFRDEGCGIAPGYVGDSIFALGSAHKSKALWQQGAFGIGGATTFRNATAVVLVSRRALEMRSEEDRILIAVCLWQHSVKGKGLFYLVTSDWDEGRNPTAEPWSAPASAFPHFAPGTHLALIEYGTERLHSLRHSDNPNSFDRILDTRLFSPVCPVRFDNHLIRNDHARVRRGLARRFEDNPRDDRRERTANMPFRVAGHTYELPLTFYFFDSARRASGEADTVGDKKNFVADGHSLMFTSNGQAHHHWTPLEFRDRTKLNKLAGHVLVVVETDPLPIAVRTDFFTADRSGVRASEETLRLESNVAEFLAGWDELKEINSALVLESIQSSRNGRPTLEISRQISRALAARQSGFSLLASNRGGTFGREPGGGRAPKPPAVLHADPTFLRGPERIAAVQGASKTLHYVIDAKDEFMASGRGRLTVRCTHPEIGDEDIAVGPLHNGRIRVIITVPAEAELGQFILVAGVYGWERASGGLGDDLERETRFDVVAEAERRPTPQQNGKKQPKSSEGPQVALLWRGSEEPGFTPIVAGKVEEIAARLLATETEYAELAELGDTPVLTIYLNHDYAPLKRYMGVRQRDLVAGTPAQDRYAVDLGVAMLVLHQEREVRVKKGERVDEELLETARHAAAQGALSILPQFDELVRQAGIDM
jgi:hypothetical protein